MEVDMHISAKDHRFSDHAIKQIQRRGRRSRDADLLLAWADAEAHVGDGARSLWCSSLGLREMRADGVPAAQVERMRRLAGIVTGRTVITVLHMNERRGRRYRAGQ